MVMPSPRFDQPAMNLTCSSTTCSPLQLRIDDTLVASKNSGIVLPGLPIDQMIVFKLKTRENQVKMKPKIILGKPRQAGEAEFRFDVLAKGRLAFITDPLSRLCRIFKRCHVYHYLL